MAPLCDKWMEGGCILAHTMHPETSEEHLCQVFLWVGVMMASTTLVAITMPKKVAWVLRLGGPAVLGKVGVAGCRSRLRTRSCLDPPQIALRKLIASFEYESSEERYKHV